MRFIADFHIHSHFSIATSKQLIPEYLDYWARIKGITVVGTGDFTHPGWSAELIEKLEPAEQERGLFKLKKDYLLDEVQSLPQTDLETPRFVLTAEISSIYKRDDKVRKVHNVIFSPDFETVDKIQQKLEAIGNITSDGRPILGLDSRDLLEIALEASEDIFFLPAHIWTPWFSALGSKSGFDTIADCYADLAHHIFAVETGLSSDPPMNWMCSFLDNYTLLSNSDAHSPEKLGREANLFDTDISYPSIINAIKDSGSEQFLGTVEFFPQEGKYHYDGHRKCGICWDPVETEKHQTICAVCGKPVTVGVMNRVMALSDREDIAARPNRAPFYSLTPLKEILSEIHGVGPNSKKVQQAYHSLVQKMGSEFNILLDLPVDEIRNQSSEILAEAIRRLREREVYVTEGFDGEFGHIRVFQENEISNKNQDSLFEHPPSLSRPPRRPLINFDLEVYRQILNMKTKHQDVETSIQPENKSHNHMTGLNEAQREAVKHTRGPALVLAGPGTGKTRVLTSRIANLIQNGESPESILAVTFTNKAAGEMRVRLTDMMKEALSDKVQIATFHGLGYSILKEQLSAVGRQEGFLIIDRDDAAFLLRHEFGVDPKEVKSVCQVISQAKNDLLSKDEIEDAKFAEFFNWYELLLQEQNAFDLDDLVYQPYQLFRIHQDILEKYRQRYQWILIDEYQDINFGQYQWIRQLTPGDQPNLFAIGDPNQAIYGFRGADVRFIRKFQDDFPEASVYRLQTSYRCSDHILKASGNVISDEKDREQPMLSGLQEGVKIHISKHPTDKSEAEFVARTIESMMGGLRFFSMDSDITQGHKSEEVNSLSDFAVLCRTHRAMASVEKAFQDHSVPFQTIGERPFFKIGQVKIIIDIIKFIGHRKNRFLKTRLLDDGVIELPVLDKLTTTLPQIDNIAEAIKTIIEIMKMDKTEALYRKLISIADCFGNDFERFLKFTSMGAGIDTLESNTEAVSLLTMHASKGLEFECVFIIGCEEGLLPYSLYKSGDTDIDEERRLLYVGMTRAKKILYLSHANKRFLQGRSHSQNRSRFLDAIEKELIEQSKSEYKKHQIKGENQLGLFS